MLFTPKISRPFDPKDGTFFNIGPQQSAVNPVASRLRWRKVREEEDAVVHSWKSRRFMKQGVEWLEERPSRIFPERLRE